MKLSYESPKASRFPRDQRDAEVATLTIQWLGSPVGQAFLRDLGYTKR